MNKPLQTRPAFFSQTNGKPAPLPFSRKEYAGRLAKLRQLMTQQDLDGVLLTSMHNVAYYSGFLYCSFGRPYACCITATEIVTVSANIDFGQPGRRGFGDNVIYTDWQRDSFWRAVKSILGSSRRIGIEGDHLTVVSHEAMKSCFSNSGQVEIHEDIMRLRMVKSEEEIKLIKGGARIADVGGAAIREAIRPGTREIDVAMAGRDAMETAIAESYPDSELRDTWVWFQSGINTDGAHNPVTTRKLIPGDILSMNTFPMISGYYTALERTMFLADADADSLAVWQVNVEAHELGLSLIRPGISCMEICESINQLFKDKGLLAHRTFGYGHSFGVLSHYYGREAGLEIREDVSTVLQPGMVISMEPMLTIPEGQPGAGGYREHDIVVVQQDGAENITGFPYGPEHNIVAG